MSITRAFILLLYLLTPAQAWSDANDASDLHQQYHKLSHASAGTIFANTFPFKIYSTEEKDRLSADVYGVINRPFGEVTTTLTNNRNWCEFIPLTLNVKTCTQQQDLLTVYAGRKHYQKPEEAFPLNYLYRVTADEPHYMKVSLAADQGPFGTRDYDITVEAIPIEGTTFIHIHTSYQTSIASRLGTQTYLATLGRSKVGFSVEHNRTNGEPVHIKGIRGIIERNVMRYYLALQAFLDTAHLSNDKRFEARINTWFDLAEKYPTQLHEVERKEYLQIKRQEWSNQLQLQRNLLQP